MKLSDAEPINHLFVVAAVVVGGGVAVVAVVLVLGRSTCCRFVIQLSVVVFVVAVVRSPFCQHPLN